MGLWRNIAMLQTKVNRKRKSVLYGMYKLISLILHVMSVQFQDRTLTRCLTLFLSHVCIFTLHTLCSKHSYTSTHSQRLWSKATDIYVQRNTFSDVQSSWFVQALIITHIVPIYKSNFAARTNANHFFPLFSLQVSATMRIDCSVPINISRSVNKCRIDDLLWVTQKKKNYTLSAI